MQRCAGIKRDGGRCSARAMPGREWCYNHDPSREEERRLNAGRGGKAGGRGRASPLAETAEAKRQIRELVTKLLAGKVERDVATAAFNGLNVLARYLNLEREVRMEEELIPRIEALEARSREEARQWGA